MSRKFKVGDEVIWHRRAVVKKMFSIGGYVIIDGSEQWADLCDLHPAGHGEAVTQAPAPITQPEPQRWEDVEFSVPLGGTWDRCDLLPLSRWGAPRDHEYKYRHARTHEPISYEQFLSLVNKAKAEQQPTPAEVTQATQVYASMERERLWAGFAGQAMASGSTSTMSVLKADAMLAEFYERFRKGGE